MMDAVKGELQEAAEQGQPQLLERPPGNHAAELETAVTAAAAAPQQPQPQQRGDEAMGELQGPAGDGRR